MQVFSVASIPSCQPGPEPPRRAGFEVRIQGVAVCGGAVVPLDTLYVVILPFDRPVTAVVIAAVRNAHMVEIRPVRIVALYVFEMDSVSYNAGSNFLWDGPRLFRRHAMPYCR